MFGFLSPSQRLPEWRRSYARVCQYQRKLFGLTSLPFLSYEAVFLYQVAVDLGLISALDATAPTCCRLRRLPKETLADERVGRYAAAFGVVLAGVKLDDDVRDSGRVAQRILRRKYRKQVVQARTAMAAIAGDSVSAIEEAVGSHLVLEQQSAVALEDYVGPTGQGFARVFSGVADREQKTLAELGACVGKAIIAWDCAVDYETDRIRGDFNPLRSEVGVQRGFELCLLQLATMGWKLPEGCVSQRVIASVVRRVRNRMQNPIVNKIGLLERWGLVRQRGYTYAGCDGCEALCCITEGCGGVAEAGACCGEVGCCCDGFICCAPCDPCWLGNDGPCESEKSKREREENYQKYNKQIVDEIGLGSTKDQQSPKAGPYAEYFGRLGETYDDLAPSGFVVMDGDRLPATSDSGFLIEAGKTVRVVATDGFGVRVAPSTDRSAEA